MQFGILHCIALCSFVALAFLRLGWGNLAAGLVAVAAGSGACLPPLDEPALQWTGLTGQGPPSFDFQPFFPWFGVVLLGIIAGSKFFDTISNWRSLGRLARALAFAGRHSLFLYMAHVPVLVSAMLCITWLR